MTSRTSALSIVAPVMLALSACSASDAAGQTPSTTGGMIELAVSETCADAADPACLSVNGQRVLLPSSFELAEVEDATVAEDSGQNVVGVTFTEDGAEVFHTMTEQAAQAGSSARLVISIGQQMRAAVAVPQAMTGDQVQIILSPDEDAQEVVDLIRGAALEG